MTYAALSGLGPRVRAYLQRRGDRVSFLWGFSEATLFFILPDVAVGAVALFGLRRGLRATGAAVAGAVLGGVALYLAARWTGPPIRMMLDQVPGVPTSFLTRVQHDVAEQGGLALFLGPTHGIPYKLYAAEWALSGRSLGSLLAWTVLARTARIGLFATIAWACGRLWRRWFGADRPGPLLLAYLAGWALIYIGYFITIGF